MIDRCQSFWTSKNVLNKSSIDKSKKRKGMFICVGGAKQSEEGFIGATVVMDLFFKAINTEYTYNMLVDNTDEVFVGESKALLKKAYDFGVRLAQT